MDERQAAEELGKIFDGEYAGYELKTQSVETKSVGDASVMSWQGMVYDPKTGAMAGEIRREYFEDADGNAVVKHERMMLGSKMQGKGFSTAFSAKSEDEYRKMGIDRIELETALDGSYVWGKAGYDWKPKTRFPYQLISNLEEALGYEGLDPEEWEDDIETDPTAAMLKRLMDANDTKEWWISAPTPWEFANLPGAREWMADSDWVGMKKL